MDYQPSVVGLALVGCGVAAAVLIVSATRRFFAGRSIRDSHDSIGSLLSIVGTLYAVLLGLVVVDAMARFEQSMEGVHAESNCLADIFLLGGRFPEPHASRVRDLCRRYAREVAETEWPLMRQGRMSVDARRTALAIARSVDRFEPVTEAHKAAFAAFLEQARELWDRRRDRATIVESGIPAVEWVTLLVGAAVVMFFVGLFSIDHAGLRHLMPALAALVIVLNLYLVSLFGYPFTGELSVSRRPFMLDIGVFSGAFDDDPPDAGGTGVPTAP